MSQHDYNIANAGGAAVRGDINDALQAILTSNSGTSAPTVTAPFMLWFDTANGVLKQRNAADTAWVVATGRLINIQIFTANGTYTPSPGTTNCLVEAVGGGGGSGGCGATGSGQLACSAGGGGGAYVKGWFPVATLSGLAVTIGAGGAAGASTPGNGGDGGQTSIGTVVVAPGGLGSAACSALTASMMISGAAGAGGTPTAGGNILSLYGGAGKASILMPGPSGSIQGSTGDGGGTPFGVVGSPTFDTNAYGRGGNGITRPPSFAASAGVAGRPGVAIIYEYA